MNALRPRSAKQMASAKQDIEELERIGKGFEQRKQSKKLRQFFVKEVQRNKAIMQMLVRKSFGSFSSEQEEVDEKQVDSVFPYVLDNRQESIQQHERPHQVVDNRQLRQEYFMADFERQLLQEKQEEINRLERDALNINNLMGQLALNVKEQDENLDIISDQFLKTRSNLVATNKELVEADKISRQSKSKYLLLALVAFLITSTVVVSSLFYFDIFSF